MVCRGAPSEIVRDMIERAIVTTFQICIRVAGK